MKRILIAGNWKMNTNAFEGEKLSEYIVGGYTDFKENVNVLVCPPFTSLASVSKVVSGTKVALGAQNCHILLSGAFTGEVSIPMLEYLNCTYIIIGHSERRAYYHEDDIIVNEKAKAVLNSGLSPIVCIGETLSERQNGKTWEILQRQIDLGLNFPVELDISKLVIAYEPVWAIGTGLAATADQIAEAHAFIREKLAEKIGNIGYDTLILYGGSVTAANAKSILETDNVNGALIGGASLKGDVFLSIIKTAQEI